MHISQCQATHTIGHSLASLPSSVLYATAAITSQFYTWYADHVERMAGKEVDEEDEGCKSASGTLAWQDCADADGRAMPSSPAPADLLESSHLQRTLSCRQSICDQGLLFLRHTTHLSFALTCNLQLTQEKTHLITSSAKPCCMLGGCIITASGCCCACIMCPRLC